MENEQLVIEVVNQAEVDEVLKGDDSSNPQVRFELKITVPIIFVKSLSVGGINGFFLAEAIKYIERLDIYDDYDGFSSSSDIAFENDDGVDLTYCVSISLQVEN